MSNEKVCPNGHVYIGNRCARDNWEEPAEVKAVENPNASVKPNNKDIPKETPKVKAKKTVKKEVKKVAKKGKKKA